MITEIKGSDRPLEANMNSKDLFVVLKETRLSRTCRTVLNKAYTCLEDAQNSIVNGAEKRGLIIYKINENNFIDDFYAYHIFKLQIV